MQYRLNIAGVYIDVEAESEEQAAQVGLEEYPAEYRRLYEENPDLLQITSMWSKNEQHR